jgi:hypothetical protein
MRADDFGAIGLPDIRPMVFGRRGFPYEIVSLIGQAA